MRRFLKLIGLCLVVLLLATVTMAKSKKPKPGPLTGTWDCMSHGGPQGDLGFTLYLEQNKDIVTGSVSSPIGSTEISSGTFKKKALEIHLDTPQGTYLLTAKLKKAQLAGEWSHDTEAKGTWQGKKQPEAKK